MTPTATELWPLLLYIAAVVGLVVFILALSSVLGPKTKLRRATAEPFESGILAVGPAQTTVTVEFYLVAMFFVIFDLETVFIVAWAISFFELGWKGYWAIFVFIVILALTLVYIWKIGALDWGKKTRVGLDETPGGET